MANIQIKPAELSSGVAKTITLNTKDTYVLENIDVVVKPQAGSFNNAPTEGVTYTENTETNTILPAEGFLYLNKGWFDNTKISLGHLIPDDTNYTNAGVAHILYGYEAYDTNGKKLIGTMATVTPKFDGGGLNVTPTVTGFTAPTVTVSSSGSFKTSTTFGVTTKKPTSGTDGTNYLTIDGSASKTDGSVTATATYSRDAVLYNGATTGYINMADNTEALPATTSTSKTSTAQGIVPTVTDNFAPLYIPIVSVSGQGGVMEKATSGNSFTFSGELPQISLTYGGKFTDTTGTSYGVTTTAPTGTDGSDFLSVSVGGENDTKTLTGNTTIKINRAAVTNDGLKQGAINIADGATLLAGDSSTFTHTDTFDITATLSNKKSYYIPIIKSMPVIGGALSQGTSSVTVSGTNPTVTIKKSGKFTEVSSDGVGTSYGVTTIAPTTGTDGTDFLKITIDGSSDTQTFTGSSSIKVSRADVKHDGAAAGAIKWTDGSSILAGIDNQEFTASTDNTTQKKVTASVTGGTSYYIPIVSLTNKGTGGAVTVSASANATTTTNPSMDFDISGTIIDDEISSLGVSHSQPTSGEYYSLTIEPKLLSSGKVSGKVSGTWSRTAVKSNGTYKGAVSLTTETQFLATGSDSIGSTDFEFGNIGVETSAITSEDKNWYFTKANLGNITGGGLTAGELSITSNTAPYVTPDISFLSRTGSTNGSVITPSTYGITETAPNKGNWVVFDPTGTPTDATYTGSVTVTRSAASATVTKGLTTGETKNLEAKSETYSNTKTITPGVKDGTSRYIPVRNAVASVHTHTITKPIVKCIESVLYYVNGTQQPSTPAGILSGQTSNPSDFGTASYIRIVPNVHVTDGSSTASASAKIEAGITKGGEDLSSKSIEKVEVTRDSKPEVCFIKVYDGTWSVN